jgi:3-oxoacyl-[acyl-carrier protein] reductase
MNIDLSQRCALITGGSSGLGLAMAQRFASCGARVVVLARDPARLAQAQKELDALGQQPARTLACDLTDTASVDAVLAELDRAGIHPDILVNNAGTSARSEFLELQSQQLQADFQLKVFSAIKLTQHVLPHMKAQGFGRIINVAAIVGKTPNAGSAPTALSRAAGLAWTKSLSLEFASFGITVNALCVGKIDSGQWERRYQELGSGQSYEAFLAELGQNIPMKRMGRAQEFANVAAFLASDHASYVTGSAINVDGGLCAVT